MAVLLSKMIRISALCITALMLCFHHALRSLGISLDFLTHAPVRFAAAKQSNVVPRGNTVVKRKICWKMKRR